MLHDNELYDSFLVFTLSPEEHSVFYMLDLPLKFTLAPLEASPSTDLQLMLSTVMRDPLLASPLRLSLVSLSIDMPAALDVWSHTPPLQFTLSNDADEALEPTRVRLVPPKLFTERAAELERSACRLSQLIEVNVAAAAEERLNSINELWLIVPFD